MSFGVLTTNSIEEALARAADGTGNKGHEAAVAAIEMAEVVAQLTRQATPRTRHGVARIVKKDPRHRAREARCRFSISGTSASGDVDNVRRRRSSICSGRTRIRRPTTCAPSRRRWRATRPSALGEIDTLIADTARELAPRADGDPRPLSSSGWRSARLLRDRVDAAGGRHQRSPRAGAHVHDRRIGEVHQRDAGCDPKKNRDKDTEVNKGHKGMKARTGQLLVALCPL